jgi:hypothetical protein
MSSGLVGAIKQAARDYIDNAKMCDLRYGKVTSVSPLKVQVTNQFTIPSSMLVVPERLTNGALKIGDKVALLRKQGGQSYFILDRI